jgi:disulfide bond formation protein DsbB
MNMKTRIVAVIVLALAHFGLTLVAYGKADAMESGENSQGWEAAAKVLAMPVLYGFAKLESRVALPKVAGLDWLPFAMVLNSLFWGVVTVAVVVLLRKRASRGDVTT